MFLESSDFAEPLLRLRSQDREEHGRPAPKTIEFGTNLWIRYNVQQVLLLYGTGAYTCIRVRYFMSKSLVLKHSERLLGRDSCLGRNGPTLGTKAVPE
jgi:hypothetical protein